MTIDPHTWPPELRPALALEALRDEEREVPTVTDILKVIEEYGRRRYEEGRAHGEAAANRALGGER